MRKAIQILPVEVHGGPDGSCGGWLDEDAAGRWSSAIRRIPMRLERDTLVWWREGVLRLDGTDAQRVCDPRARKARGQKRKLEDENGEGCDASSIRRRDAQQASRAGN